MSWTRRPVVASSIEEVFDAADVARDVAALMRGPPESGARRDW